MLYFKAAEVTDSMRTINQIKLAMKLRKRRECCVMGECLFFMALQQSEERIIQNHRSASALILEEGVKMLESVTSQYLKEKYQHEPIPQTFGFNFQVNIVPGLLEGKKQLISQSSQNSYTEPKRCYSFDKSQMKKQQMYIIPNASNKKHMSETEELRQSLKKLDLQDRTYEEQANYENMNCANLEHLKQKTVAELIMESNRKMEEKLSKNKQLQEQRERNFSSDSSYPMTDYSSNQSSNDPDYEEQFFLEQSAEKRNISKMAQSDLGSCRSLSQPVHTGTGFQAMKLMHSPKKQKVKRLYVRRKRVPRWAENLDKVNESVKEQKKDAKFDPFEIYGICLVEKLDTNVIFNGNQIYHRGSSARWNRHPYVQLE